MITQTYDNIFSEYYTLYRAEASVPDSDDDEYTIGMRFANEALSRWEHYDATYWRELFTTLQGDGGGSQTITAGQTAYLAPANFKEAGGYVRVRNANGTTQQSFAILEPQEAQFRGDQNTFAYFTQGQNYYSAGTVSQTGTTVTGVGTVFTAAMIGMKLQYASGQTATVTGFTNGTTLTVSPSQTVSSTTYKIINSGFTLNLNPGPVSTLDGLDIDYVYYKKATPYTTGSSQSEIPNAEFVVHRMLAQRFRASRNPYYNSALRDAEDALKIMKMDNESGNWSNPPQMADTSSMVWGAGHGGRFFE